MEDVFCVLLVTRGHKAGAPLLKPWVESRPPQRVGGSASSPSALDSVILAAFKGTAGLTWGWKIRMLDKRKHQLSVMKTHHVNKVKSEIMV